MLFKWGSIFFFLNFKTRVCFSFLEAGERDGGEEEGRNYMKKRTRAKEFRNRGGGRQGEGGLIHHGGGILLLYTLTSFYYSFCI
jgi:hypothetical protein